MRILTLVCFTAALLNAASADPREAPAYLLRFTLDESASRIAELMGAPTQTTDNDVNYRMWQYQIAVEDKHDFSHTFCFRKADGKLLSITRNFGEEQNVDDLFPKDKSSIYHWPKREKRQYSVLVRQLPGDRLLIGMGISQRGQPTGQILLIRREAIQFFFPWLLPQLSPSTPSASR